MWPRNAYVGQHVVCTGDVDDHLGAIAIRRGCVLPSIGIVYTIRAIGVGDCGGVGFQLKEIVNPRVAFPGVEPIFDYRMFKPVDETRLDVFREMLRHAKNKSLDRADV